MEESINTKMKALFKIHLEVITNLNPKNYPEGITPQEMLNLDLEQLREDPIFWLDAYEKDFVITGELLPE